MRNASLQLGILVVALSLVVGLFSAKAITRPIDDLTGVAHSLAQRDFSRRADVRSRTEIGELAVEQNRLLFMDSLSIIAAAVDAPTPGMASRAGASPAAPTARPCAAPSRARASGPCSRPRRLVFRSTGAAGYLFGGARRPPTLKYTQVTWNRRPPVREMGTT